MEDDKEDKGSRKDDSEGENGEGNQDSMEEVETNLMVGLKGVIAEWVCK